MFTESDHISRTADETGVLKTEWHDVHTIYQTDIRQYQTVKRYLMNQNGLKLLQSVHFITPQAA